MLWGLPVGGPYALQVRRFGFHSYLRPVVYLTLGQTLEVAVSLVPVATTLTSQRIVARASRLATATTVTDSLLHRLPSLNRDMYDFVRLAPQISTKVALAIGGISGAGTNVRFNNFLVDGASDRAVSGNSANASRPIEAVREYQVLLAPFDVRYGDFSGAMVNVVTKSGTNEPHATAFVYRRNDGLARRDQTIRAAHYDRTQFGFTLGGPLVRDRVQYFIAPEFRRLSSPALGPFVGQPAGAPDSLRVLASDVARFTSIMHDTYGLDAGSGGPVSVSSPLTNLFARLDASVPTLGSRVVLLASYGRADNMQFSRVSPDTFSLSSYGITQASGSRLASAQLHTVLRGNGYNVVTLSYRSGWFENRPDVRSPLVAVQVPRIGGGMEVLKAGSQEGSGVSQGSRAITLSEQLTVPVRASQTVVVGAEAELFRLQRGGLNGSYGTWSFSSLDALGHGTADRYQVTEDFGSAALGMRGAQYAAFASDEWRAGSRVSVTLGVRGDLFDVLDHAAYSVGVDTLFGRRTDRAPVAHVYVSPRLGVTWDLFGTGRDVIRGGAGIFTGRYPPAWAHTAIYSNGIGTGTLSCGLPGDPGAAPTFEPHVRAAPVSCANGSGASPRGDVDLLDRHLRMAQSTRVSLAYERRLPWNMVATTDVMLTRARSDFIFVNLNLAGPQGVDPHGRVMYGTIDVTGASRAATRSTFPEVIEVRNVSGNHAFQVDARLEKRFSSRVGAMASYTFTRVRDVALPIRSGMRGTVNWTSQRVISGRHDDMSTGVSLYDLPHRVVLAGTVAAPWHRLTTDISFYYVGESGSPFTYVAGGVGKRGDLNADGAVGNDPIYVPTRAGDPSQILFVADTPDGDVAQQKAFDQFIDATPCLRRQRGAIMRRNSCREPWSHTTIASVRQRVSLPGIGGVALHVDLFNVLNLLSSRWGRYRVAIPQLLTQVGETSGGSGVAQPVFRFAATSRWSTLPTESAYQLQFGLRYEF